MKKLIPLLFLLLCPNARSYQELPACPNGLYEVKETSQSYIEDQLQEHGLSIILPSDQTVRSYDKDNKRNIASLGLPLLNKYNMRENNSKLLRNGGLRFLGDKLEQTYILKAGHSIEIKMDENYELEVVNHPIFNKVIGHKVDLGKEFKRFKCIKPSPKGGCLETKTEYYKVRPSTSKSSVLAGIIGDAKLNGKIQLCSERPQVIVLSELEDLGEAPQLLSNKEINESKRAPKESTDQNQGQDQGNDTQPTKVHSVRQV